MLTFAGRILRSEASCCCLTDLIMLYESSCSEKMGKNMASAQHAF